MQPLSSLQVLRMACERLSMAVANGIEIECAGQNWLIAAWSDGTWCDLSEIIEMTHLSDDYMIMRVMSHDEGYVPIRTERWKKPCK